MIEHQYPKLDENWNLYLMTMKLASEGFNVNYINANAEFVWLYFETELSFEEKTRLDSLLADEKFGLYPEYLTKDYTVIEVDDLYDNWKALETKSGLKFKWIFANVPFRDKLEIWVEGELSEKDMKDLKDAYLGLFRGKKQ